MPLLDDTEYEDLNSSNLDWLSYDADSQTLTIGFHLDNRVYEYYDVPERVVDELVGASSQGVYFRENLYHGYKRGARGQFRRREKGITYDEVT